MLFNKYQYHEEIHKRGYSQTCNVQDNSGKCFWVKWILGIEKSSTKTKILADKLRHLQKARHTSLPEIIEYGFDEEQQTFAIVVQHLENVETLEDSYQKIKTQNFISGLIDLADCLNDLHKKYQINHGDVHPANILIDNKGQFYLVDFGLSDITKTLSQDKDLEIFARDFAAPEKFNRLAIKGFPYQSDIYSFGKVIDWFFHQRREIIPEEQNKTLQRLLAENPAERPNWQDVIDFLRSILTSYETESVQITFNSKRCSPPQDFLETINTDKPLFDISPKDSENYLMNIILGNYFCECATWIKAENKILINEIKPLETYSNEIIKAKKRILSQKVCKIQSFIFLQSQN